jgi:protein-S-isoprenylcysteine O-methyltransferase Ste14/GNAT superfamily N-acetyltransferase
MFRAASFDNDDIYILKDIAKRVIRSNYTPFLGADAVCDFIESGQADKEIDDGMHNCILLTVDGVTIGFAIIRESLLHLIMIDTPFQRSGYGSRLLRHIEDGLFMKYNCISLNSFKANTTANRFYLKNGWTLAQDDEGHESDDMMLKFEKKRASTAEAPIKPKIPLPLLLILLSIFAMAGLASWGAMPLSTALSWRLLCGGIIEVIALTMLASRIRLFVKRKTTWLPMNPEDATVLVTDGIYRYTRNPMYLAQALLLLGIGIALGDGLGLLLVPCFMFYMTRFQIMPEEQILEMLFGDAYRNYMQRTRRWL